MQEHKSFWKSLTGLSGKSPDRKSVESVPQFQSSRVIQAAVGSTLASLAVLTTFLAGCTRSHLDGIGRDSVEPSSSLVNAENYRKGLVKILVPPGNSSEIEWSNLYANLPDSTKEDRRWKPHANDPAGLASSLERSYRYTINSFTKNPRTLKMLKDAAKLHRIEPATLLAVIIGEHTFNVGVIDDIQNYGALAPRWATGWAKKFTTGKFGLGTPLSEILARAEFEECRVPTVFKTDAAKWDCYGSVWAAKFAGKVDPQSPLGMRWPNGGMRSVFFDPILAGHTYGMGQLDPLRALMVSDRVARATGMKELSVDDPQTIYETIIDPERGVHYIAATIRLQMERMYEVAHFDISQNAGISATIYNKGGELKIARERFQKSLMSLQKTGEVELPKENFYGWFVNLKVDEIRQIMDRVP